MKKLNALFIGLASLALGLALPLVSNMDQVKAAASDVTLEHSVDKVNAQMGETLNYTFKITNVSSNTLNAFSAKSRFTNGTYVPGSARLNLVNGGSLISDIAVPDDFFTANGVLLGNIIPGDVITITYRGTVNNALAHLSEVQAAGQVWWSGQEGIVKTAATVVIVPDAKLCGTLTADVTTIAPGGVITYNINVCNQGNVDLTNIVVRDDMPNRAANRITTYVAGSTLLTKYGQTTKVSDDWMNNGTAMNIANLRPGDSAVITLKLRVNDNVADGTTVENVAQLKSDQTLEFQCANQIKVVKPVGAPTSRLNVGKFVVWDNKEFAGALDPSAHKFATNEEVTYRIKVENPTDTVANSVRIEDRLVDNIYLDYVRSNPGGNWNDSTKTLSVDFGDMAAKSMRVWEVVFRVRSGLTTNTDLVQRNSVSVTSANAGSASAEATVTVRVGTAPVTVTTSAVAQAAKKPTALPATGPETALLLAVGGLSPLGLLLRRFKKI